MIYFVHNPSASAVKIGYSADPWRRLGDLLTGSVSPLHLIGAIPGGRDVEARLHREFWLSRISREWFQSGPVLDFFRAHLIRRAYVNLFEIDDEGNKVNYYKRADELTIDEAGKHLDGLRATVEKDNRILAAYLEFYSGKFGDDIQGHFGFGMT